MFLTEAEILDTPLSLNYTCQYFEKNKKNLEQFFQENQQKKFTILGCGSSYMLAKSTASLFASLPGTSANAIAAGDYIVDPLFWYETVKGSIVLLLSRSGKTSEMVWALKHIKQAHGCPAVSITTEDGNDLMPLCDLNLTLNWCHDDSVCQTRTVTNLYASTLLLAAEYARDDRLRESVLAAMRESTSFQLKYRPVLAEIANLDWDNVVVLADGPICGIAEEGALAFTEISMLTGRYFHLLDYRHGPIVVSGKRTLTLALLRPGEEKLQSAMMKDVIQRGGPVVTISHCTENRYDAAAHLQIQNPISELLQKRGQNREMGLYSCCSANEYVIRAALRRAKDRDTVVLVEATANQVNQNGGYTGMTPVAFRAFLNRLAEEENFPIDKLLCGGDHLGPLTWTHLPEAEAMKNAGELIRSYVLAGFSKIHIDTSMRLADHAPNERLSDVVIAHRGAQLCRIAEEAFAQYSAWHPEAPAPVYIIGSEVPIPGGAQENEDSVTVTAPEDCEATLSTFRAAFCSNHLEAAWERVVAIVVQPGVEFADESVIEYDRTAAHSLTEHLKRHPNLVFEGHSTDYQPRQCLRKMVEDGIAILKVGPALTFALREGLFALEQIERELYGMMDFPCSHFREILEQVMLEDQGQWTKYYHGSMPEKRYARAFSYSDRARYYLTNSKVQGALRLLLDNLNTAGIPMALISQYMPVQYARVHVGILPPKAEDLLMDRVGDCIDDYLYAVLRD